MGNTNEKASERGNDWSNEDMGVIKIIDTTNNEELTADVSLTLFAYVMDGAVNKAKSKIKKLSPCFWRIDQRKLSWLYRMIYIYWRTQCKVQQRYSSTWEDHSKE